MENEVKKLLFDISVSITDIEIFIGTNKDYDNYHNDIFLKSAVERKLEIIGEAMNRLLNRVPDIAITNARRIVDVRNKIIHGYDEIEDVNIWAILINHLPLLKTEISDLLEKSEM